MTRVFANIRGSVLRWARESAGFPTSASAAEKIGVDVEVYESWESEVAYPSVPQLRKAAIAFGRPLAVFFLREPPTSFQVLRDLRRLPGTGARFLSVGIQAEINAAQAQRDVVIEMSEELGRYVEPFDFSASIRDDPEKVGFRLRSYLDVTPGDQSKWRDAEGRVAFSAWRNRIETAGVLVFQATRFSSDEASGFAISHPIFPIIVVNRADYPTRRTFSLLHELAHLAVRLSGVSDLETDVTRPPEDQAIEVFCNHVAAATLIPKSDLLALPTVVTRGGQSERWTDAEIAELARTFGASRDALVRRLLTFGRTTQSFYKRKHAQYAAEHAERRAKMKAEASPDGIPRNMPQETMSNLGRPLVGLVLGGYHQERLTLSEVSGYLGLKVKHIAKLEQVAGLR